MSDYDDALSLPSADPQIQKEYEAALGAFLVAFNRVDRTLSDLISWALHGAKRKGLDDLANANYSQKLIYVDLLTMLKPDRLPENLIAELKALGNERNSLAHGHFDQNPYDGSYQLIKRSGGKLDMPVERILALTERVEVAWNKLRHTEALYFFDDVSIPANPFVLPKDRVE